MFGRTFDKKPDMTDDQLKMKIRALCILARDCETSGYYDSARSYRARMDECLDILWERGYGRNP